MMMARFATTYTLSFILFLLLSSSCLCIPQPSHHPTKGHIKQFSDNSNNNNINDNKINNNQNNNNVNDNVMPPDVLSPPSRPLIKATPSLIAELCRNLQTSPFHILRCAPDDQEELSTPGKLFLRDTNTLSSKLEIDPVIFLPGLGGSAIDAKIDKTDKPDWYCFKKHDWYRLFLNLENLFAQDCWWDNMQLHYNGSWFHNSEGVQTRPADFGGVAGISYLDFFWGYPIRVTGYYATIIESFKKVGYEIGKTLFGAPFDWRLPADFAVEHGGMSDRLTTLIEKSYSINGRPAHIITHSMGGPTFVYFLNTKTEEWRQKYIASFMPIAGPWAGSPKVLRAIISGDSFGVQIRDHSLLRLPQVAKFVRQAGGPIELLPDPLFWPKDKVFVTTPARNYTSLDYRDLFHDMGTEVTHEIWKEVGQIVDSLQPPRVPVHCLYGTNVRTEIGYTYGNGFDQQPTEIAYTMEGDGTVPLASLQLCRRWNEQQEELVTVQEFNLMNHMDVIESPKIISYLLNITTRAV